MEKTYKYQLCCLLPPSNEMVKEINGNCVEPMITIGSNFTILFLLKSNLDLKQMNKMLFNVLPFGYFLTDISTNFMMKLPTEHMNEISAYLDKELVDVLEYCDISGFSVEELEEMKSKALEEENYEKADKLKLEIDIRNLETENKEKELLEKLKQKYESIV
jgi:hypothetical protein